MVSRNQDQPLDTSSRHSVQLRGVNHKGFGDRVQSGELESVEVDHFYHQGDFWTAVIPLDGVASIYGQAFNFSKPRTRKGKNGPEVIFHDNGLPKRRIGILNHVQTRFQMKPGKFIELYPLGGEFDQPAHKIDDFVYSVEAVGPVGSSFNFKDAMTGTLTCAHRFLSTQEMVFERLAVEGMYITESPALPLDDDEMKMALALSLSRADEAGMTEPYYLYRVCATNNCTSNAFAILDRVAKYTWPQRIGAMLYRLPLQPRVYLRMRGLDADRSYFKLLRTEFEELIAAPETQARKRTHVREKLRLRRAALGRPEKRRKSEAAH